MHQKTHNFNQIKLKKKTSQYAILKQTADKKFFLQLTKEEIMSSLTSLYICHFDSLS